MSRAKKALIIGGGVAGPVAAMALGRAGIDSVVYEAYSRGADDAGAFLTHAAHGHPERHRQAPRKRSQRRDTC